MKFDASKKGFQDTIEEYQFMKNKQIKGHVKEVEGKIKEVAGKLVGNERLEEKGKAEKIAGKHQAARAELKDDIQKLAGG